MRQTLICIASILVAAGALEASSMISCSGSATSVNSCMSSHLSDFNLSLQWSALSATDPSMPTTVDGSIYNTTWTGAGGSLSVAGAEMRLAENYEMIWTGTKWVDPTNFPHDYRFTGNFDAPPDTVPSSAVTPGNPGDYLVGSASSTNPLVISASSNLFKFGFRVSAITLTTFDLSLNLYSGANGTGSVQTLSLGSMSPGGNCPGLFSNPPQPCNTAPFIEVTTTGTVRSFSVNTSDSSGFYIDTFYADAAPEPAPFVLTGIGLLSFAGFIRFKRRAQS